MESIPSLCMGPGLMLATQLWPSDLMVSSTLSSHKTAGTGLTTVFSELSGHNGPSGLRMPISMCLTCHSALSLELNSMKLLHRSSTSPLKASLTDTTTSSLDGSTHPATTCLPFSLPLSCQFSSPLLKISMLIPPISSLARPLTSVLALLA